MKINTFKSIFSCPPNNNDNDNNDNNNNNNYNVLLDIGILTITQYNIAKYCLEHNNMKGRSDSKLIKNHT